MFRGNKLGNIFAKFVWGVVVKISLFHIVYRLARPLLGNRAALLNGELAPALLFFRDPSPLYALKQRDTHTLGS